jgi:hypothetical protein
MTTKPEALRARNQKLRDQLKPYVNVGDNYAEGTGYPFRKRLATSLQEYLVSRSSRAFNYNGFDFFRAIRGHLLDEKYQAIEFILDKMQYVPGTYSQSSGTYGINTANQLQAIIEESSYKDVLSNGDLGKFLSVHTVSSNGLCHR